MYGGRKFLGRVFRVCGEDGDRGPVLEWHSGVVDVLLDLFQGQNDSFFPFRLIFAHVKCGV